MKNKVEVTVGVDLDEVRHALNQLPIKEQVDFAISLGEDLSDCIDYWEKLYWEVKKIHDELVEEGRL